MIYFDFLNVAQYDKWCYFLDFFLEGEKERERGELFFFFFEEGERRVSFVRMCMFSCLVLFNGPFESR